MDFRDLRVPDTGVIGPHYGIIADTATNAADRVGVILPEFDPELSWGPCRWQSRDNFSLPVRGDEALVVFDNRRAPWIVAWWPGVAFPPVPYPDLDLINSIQNSDMAAGMKKTVSSFAGGPPALPSNGDIWIATNCDGASPATNTRGFSWQFRYNSTSASSYKWECCGGTPIFINDVGIETNSAALVWETRGAKYAIVRPGDYLAGAHARMMANGAAGGTGVWFAIMNDSLAQSALAIPVVFTPPITDYPDSTEGVFSSMAIGDHISPAMFAGNILCQIIANLHVFPIRVS